MRVRLIFFLFMASFALYASEKQDAELPSYQKLLKDALAKKKKRELPAEVIKVMKTAEENLKKQMPTPGLSEGMIAPDFTLINQNGKMINLYQLLSKNPVILNFYRGSWCMYCSLELKMLKKATRSIEELGGVILSISPQTLKKVKEQTTKNNFPFSILSDPRAKIAKSYGLYFELETKLEKLYKEKFNLDIASFNDKGHLGLPVPATFVIGQNKEVLACFADIDYEKRMEVKDILKALKKNVKTTSKRRDRKQSEAY